MRETTQLVAQSVERNMNPATNSRAPFRFRFEDHPDALRAFEVQRKRASRHGQVWSGRHARALRELQMAYVHTGLGVTPGRTAWPLAVGCGKTESLIAFAVAQHERASRGLRPLSALVCLERVTQLSDLYREIVAAGVPESFVGLFHRKSDAETVADNLVPPAALDAIDTFPILLATHALMLRGEANIATLNRYNGSERSLVVWDESLIKSQGHYLDLTEIDGAASLMSSYCGAFSTSPVDADASAALDFIQTRLATLRQVFHAQLQGTHVAPVVFPEVSAEEETRYRAGIASVLLRGRGESGREAHRWLSEFLDHSQRPLRVVPFVDAGRKIGVVHYSTLIPSSLRRLIVLDASHNIRLLTSEHDADLRVTSTDCAVKTFEAVAVRHLRVGAGREALAKALPRRDSALVREIVADVKAWPADAAGVLVTFKSSERDIRRGRPSYVDMIRSALTAEGIDVDAKVPDGRDRLSFITWGQHLGVNHFAHCTRALLVGVLRRTRLDLSAAIVGQRDDLTAREAADSEEVARVELSEVFHHVVQAIGRGACRTTVGGKAPAMSVSIICSDEFPAAWWQSAMPGVRVSAWVPKHARPQRLSDDRAEALRIALARLPMQQQVISKSVLRKLAGLGGLSSSAYKRTLLDFRADGWVQQGRSLIRSPFRDESLAA